MNGREVYEIYAPDNAKWAEWVRPVPFVAINTYNIEADSEWTNREIISLKEYKTDTAIFVDLPGSGSIEAGIKLASLGYRPIPVFNGTDAPKGTASILNNKQVEVALISGAKILKKIELSNDANPAFLLDSTRINRYRESESVFDNSWDLYGQDIPTPEYFLKNGISKIIIISTEVNKDLKKIFLKFQKAGIEFYITDGYSPTEKIKLRKTITEYFEKEEL